MYLRTLCTLLVPQSFILLWCARHHLIRCCSSFRTLGPVYVWSRFWNGLSTRYGLSYICTSMLCFVSVRACVRVVFVCVYPCSTYCIKRSRLGFPYYNKMTLYKRHWFPCIYLVSKFRSVLVRVV